MKQWQQLRSATLERNKHLEDTLDVSERFWDDITGLQSTLKDLQDTLNNAEPPAPNPEAIKQQAEVLEVRILRPCHLPLWHSFAES